MRRPSEPKSPNTSPGSPHRATSFWDKEVLQPTHNSWMSHLEIRHFINRLITGDKGGWPMDWFAGKMPGQIFDRALSIGCGTGALERDLLRRGLCRCIDAFDGS